MNNKLDKLIKNISELPGLGKKTSTRMGINLVENREISIRILEEMIENLSYLTIDEETNILSEVNSIEYRIGKPLLVVQNNMDAQTYIELFGEEFNYFNLNINSIADITKSLVNENTIDKLIGYIDHRDISEVVFGLSPKKESEIIINLISNEILKEKPKISLSKIATGVPIGGVIEHIDSKTIRKAIEKREKI